MKKGKKNGNKITSIQYIHDPEAAKEWMNLFMEMTKEQFIESVSKEKNPDL
jgi:molybdopterin synthase catalytic subunit